MSSARERRRKPPQLTGNLSPVVFWQHAGAYLGAAKREFAHQGSLGLNFPAYFLLGRAAELTLKSFLLLRGRTEWDLRQLSHDLEAVLEDAKINGLADIAELPEDAETLILWLNAYYWSKDLEYPKTGLKSLPPKEPLLLWFEELIKALEPHLRRWTPGLDA